MSRGAGDETAMTPTPGIDPTFLQMVANLSTGKINYIMIAVQQQLGSTRKTLKRVLRAEAGIIAVRGLY